MHNKCIVNIEYDTSYTFPVQFIVINIICTPDIFVGIKITDDIYFNKKHGKDHHNASYYCFSRHNLMQEYIRGYRSEYSFHSHYDRRRCRRCVLLADYLETEPEDGGEHDQKGNTCNRISREHGCLKSSRNRYSKHK